MILENSYTHGLADSLVIPLAAKSLQSIEQYVGRIVQKSKSEKWCYVEFEPLEGLKKQKVWNHERSHLLDARMQCWVHYKYTAYRACYRRCFPDINIDDQVIDHIFNRRFAKPIGFKYLRLIHVDRGVNSSSGRGMEYDVINFNNPKGLNKFKESPNEIYYGDPSDLLKMLNIKNGAFPLFNVGKHINLFY